eukprot:8618507-Alexandrium_andersonii.AAC.1
MASRWGPMHSLRFVTVFTNKECIGSCAAVRLVDSLRQKALERVTGLDMEARLKVALDSRQWKDVNELCLRLRQRGSTAA